MRILFCGDRKWKNKELIGHKFLELYDLYGEFEVIEGGALGADTLAKEIAIEMKLPFIECKAEFEIYGKSAGPIRNKKMLTYNPNLIIAFHDNINESKGTKQMLSLAIKAKIPSLLFSNKDKENVL